MLNVCANLLINIEYSTCGYYSVVILATVWSLFSKMVAAYYWANFELNTACDVKSSQLFSKEIRVINWHMALNVQLELAVLNLDFIY